jgi:hypothetical protein
MSQDNPAISGSKSGQCQKYVFETELKRYEVDADSEKGITFQSLHTGPEKINYLVENGKETTKETGGSIMQPEKGAWRFWNLGQLEYMFLADNGSESETELERKCKEIKQLDEKKAFICSNATKIREWPERIHRQENLV